MAFSFYPSCKEVSRLRCARLINMEHDHPRKKPFIVEQAAEYLTKSPGAIRNLVMRRKIPYRKVSGRLYFFQDELDRWLDNSPGVRLEDLSK